VIRGAFEELRDGDERVRLVERRGFRPLAYPRPPLRLSVVSEQPNFGEPLARTFYERPVERVAKDLLGCYLVHKRGSRFVGGRIVEVEAYGGIGDPGSHADRAPNGRAKIMFGPAGIAYVYFTYGMHHCLNAVADREGKGSAVLIRALEPVWGTKEMRAGAPGSLPDHRLGSGPGRICRALRIDRGLNGADLSNGPIRILQGGRNGSRVERGVRVGLSLDDDRPWRFWLESRSVSL
jgi:DNA-3-methyladenine glycosylase